MIGRLSLSIWLLASLPIFAGEEEKRSYVIRVDNKPAGSHLIIIQTRDDGTTTVTAQADVAVRVAVISYKFSFRGTETWKDGKLQQFSSTTNDNGKKHVVFGEANKEGLYVKADGRETQVRGEPWLTTYWKLPPENQRGNVTLVDADTGRVVSAKLEKVGVEKITLLGKPIDCAHWKLTGGVQMDLWYDGADRLVRQEAIEEGHRTILELSRLQRE